MVKLLIVDDERIIREGIANAADWKRLGVELVGQAKNGREGLECIRQLQPDIVITDVVMPLMDGIALIEKTLELEQDVRFIVLSGYGEFDYAHRAMYCGVRHYLLKPCGANKIVLAVQEVLAELASGDNASLVTLAEAAPEQQSLVGKIKKYVAENIASPDLTLKAIAAQVLFVDPDYASKAFQRKTGEKFNAYLMRQRMEIAKELVVRLETDKISDIAERVGMGNNPQYFSQLFKRYTGKTPTEYKKTTVEG